MRKYRINESEHFNLYSMYDKLKCFEIDMQEAPAIHTQMSSGMIYKSESRKWRL